MFETASIRVQGFSWCKEPVTIGKDSATAKILCRLHNTELSELDECAAKAFAVLKQAQAVEKKREADARQNWMVLRAKINARQLERWFLKTLIDLACVHPENISWVGGAPPLQPPTSLVESCFGRRALPEYCGLRAVAGIGHQLDLRDSVGFAPIRRVGSGQLAGGLFEFRGYRFVFTLVEEDLTALVNRTAENSSAFADWRDAAIFPLRKVILRQGTKLSQEITFAWPPFGQRRRAHA